MNFKKLKKPRIDARLLKRVKKVLTLPLIARKLF